MLELDGLVAVCAVFPRAKGLKLLIRRLRPRLHTLCDVVDRSLLQRLAIVEDAFKVVELTVKILLHVLLAVGQYVLARKLFRTQHHR
jgi:hypothetical protein